jgi:adenylate kinase
MADHHILLLGPPGAGKGTQAKKLCETYGLDHVSTGDALRANKDMETEYGTPRSFMEAGELVPDEVVNEVLAAALEDADGYVLDGYPRNLDQVEYLDDATELDYVFFLDVDRETLVDRLTGRRVCTECGENYHVEFAPPEEDGVCDACGGDLHQRDDDEEDVVRERLEVYEENTEPVIEQYRDDGDLVEIDGEGAPEDVFERLTDAVEGDD